MANISHQINSLAGHQNYTATWSAQLNECLTNYVAAMLGTAVTLAIRRELYSNDGINESHQAPGSSVYSPGSSNT
ncbi:hypothetical protein DSO57_1001297 [Entomophthora muscae]|uniref:Uncharacterized protein n=1 Tax=Entomophthora muscae TaxID=34485 RepID=A0ACC2T998_9FUNG|nr:hypothetical protein DSO57_1001297 [Entomophthora muscae]